MDARTLILELATIPDPEVSIHQMRDRIGRWTSAAEIVIPRPDQTSEQDQKPWVWLYEQMLAYMADDQPSVGCEGLLWLDYWITQLSPALTPLDFAELSLGAGVDDELRVDIARVGTLSTMEFDSGHVVVNIGTASITAGFLQGRGFALQNPA